MENDRKLSNESEHEVQHKITKLGAFEIGNPVRTSGMRKVLVLLCCERKQMKTDKDRTVTHDMHMQHSAGQDKPNGSQIRHH